MGIVVIVWEGVLFIGERFGGVGGRGSGGNFVGDDGLFGVVGPGEVVAGVGLPVKIIHLAYLSGVI